MSIGRRIKERRKQLGLSADALGERLGKDRSTIYRYEKGDIENLPLDILEPIANALRTTPQYLMGWEEDPDDLVPVASDAIARMKSDAESESEKLLMEASTLLEQLPPSLQKVMVEHLRGVVEAHAAAEKNK